MSKPGTIIHLRRGPEPADVEAGSLEGAELSALETIAGSIQAGAPLNETLQIAADSIRTLLSAQRVEFRRGEPVRGSETPATKLVIPLVADGEVFATCRIEPAGRRSFSDREIASAKRIVSLAAVALRASDVHETERRRRTELETMLRVSEAVVREVDLDRILAVGLNEALAATGLEGGAVHLIDEESGDLVLAVHKGGTEELLKMGRRLPVPGSMLGDVAAQARPRLIRDVADEDDPRLQEAMRASGETSAIALAAPLIWEDEVIGVISVGAFGTRSLDRDDLSFLMALSRPIAAAVGKARLYENLKRSNLERQELLTALVNAQEDERRSIAEDIHDDTIQVLSAVSMRLQTLKLQLRESSRPLGIVEAAESTTAAIDRLRNLMFELHPRALERDGAAAALRSYLRKTFGRTDPAWTVVDELDAELPPAIRTTLYRVAIEALSNVRKHARAERVHVTLGRRDGGVFARIEDDGIGMSTGEAEDSPAGHLGVTSMHERARMAGGSCSFRSEPGTGTAVECWLPLPEATGSLPRTKA